MFVLIPLAIYKSKVLDVLRLGDPIAIGVGVQIEKERRLLLLISVALAGVCVSVGGGIIRPDRPPYSQEISGARHAKLLPLTAILGSLLLLSADTLGRVIMAPMELPVGIIVSVLGAPYFIYLLVKNI